MLEHALKGSRRYWTLVAVLSTLTVTGVAVYLYQFIEGLHVTGLNRDVTWGFYIAQLTFLVGVAASAVMVVIPYYLHDHKVFGKITVLGECVAIAACIMSMIFVAADMGQPIRLLNMLAHPSPNSPMFWDFMALMGYLGINALVVWVVFGAERKGIAAPRWIKPIILLSIPWAVSIHTVTAFLYSGLAARPFWMTAVLAPRFLASAFSAGPSLLIILFLILRRFTNFDPGKEAIQSLGKVVTYAMAINLFLVGMEVFTAGYSHIPEHMHHFEFLYLGDGHLPPWMWTSTILGFVALFMLLIPAIRHNETFLAVAAAFVFISLWIDKGLGLIIGGFEPSPFGQISGYWPNWVEVVVGIGIYSGGFLLITIMYKVIISVREEISHTGPTA